MADFSFNDNAGANRFELLLEGRLAARAEYRLEGGTLTFTHTEVSPGHEGHGLGSKIAKQSLDEARRRGLKVVPRCEFIASYIARHPEYQDLVAA